MLEGVGVFMEVTRNVSRELPPGNYLRENLFWELPTSRKTSPRNYLLPGKPLPGTSYLRENLLREVSPGNYLRENLSWELPTSGRTSGNYLPGAVKEGRSWSRSTPEVVPGFPAPESSVPRNCSNPFEVLVFQEDLIDCHIIRSTWS